MAFLGYTQDTSWKLKYPTEILSPFHRFVSHPHSLTICLKYTRNLFKVLALATARLPEGNELALKFKSVDKSLGHVKCIIGLFKIPSKVQSVIGNAKKTYGYSQIVFLQLKNGEKVDPDDVLNIAIYSTKTASKTITLVKNALFSPLGFIQSQFELSPEIDRVNYCWSYIAISGKGFKILYTSFEIIKGKDVGRRAVALVIYVSGFVLGVVKLAGYKVHPSLSITVSIADNLYKFYHVLEEVV